MKLRGLQAGLWSAVAGAALVLGAHDAHAGGWVGPTTVHAFTTQVKGALQGSNKNEQDVIEREKANQKVFAEECLGSSLAKHEKIVLVTDCGDQISPFSAVVLVVDTSTEPATILADIGGADLFLVARKEDKDGDTTQAEYRMFGGLGCGEDLFVSFNGFAKATLKPLDPKDSESPICTQSANGKALGEGGVDGDEVVLESMNVNAGARSKKIEVTAGDINDWFAP